MLYDPPTFNQPDIADYSERLCRPALSRWHLIDAATDYSERSACQDAHRSNSTDYSERLYRQR